MRRHHPAFTLIELLIVLGIIAMLAAVVLALIEPQKHLADARDVVRLNDVNTIINALHEYIIDHRGSLPPTVPVGKEEEICRFGAQGCIGVVLDALVNDSYLPTIPIDPKASGLQTNYFLLLRPNGLLQVRAPGAERMALMKAVR
ncbi:type II secretion system protein [Candidatus Peregrinibacteria bacterium]|nr:type II secretion system protein [Candidatus Peregrinibacteria bacterium]MBI3816470.1 type II secretion system protein [Candidatus Peregrinibacteria bacterium]